MSRDIDFDNMSEDDLEYMAQRPWIAEELVRQGYENPLEGFEMTIPWEPQEVTAEASPEEETSEEGEGEAEDEADTTAEDYDDWDFDDLRAEAKRRGLSAGGSALDIKVRLREDDSSEA